MFVNFQNFMIKLSNKLNKFTLVYQLVLVIILISIQLNIFNENIPIEYIIDFFIVIFAYPILTNVVNKILKRDKQDAKPFLYCPECSDAKMRTSGAWICEKCGKTFSKPKKDNEIN